MILFVLALVCAVALAAIMILFIALVALLLQAGLRRAREYERDNPFDEWPAEDGNGVWHWLPIGLKPESNARRENTRRTPTRGSPRRHHRRR